MNLMMITIKGKKALWWLCVLPVLFLFLYICSGEKGSPDGRQPELQTYRLRNGWGYRILMNDKVLIDQPTIPAIDTLMAFPDEASARSIGSLVCNRIAGNESFLITKEDIQHSLSDLNKR